MDWLDELNNDECEIHAELNYCEALRIYCKSVGHDAQFFPPHLGGRDMKGG